MQTAEEKQSEAKELSEQWNGEALRRSVSLYSEAANGWKQIKERQRAAECLREISRLQMILGNDDEARARVEEALEIENADDIREGKIKSLSILAVISLKAGKTAESEKYSNEAVFLSKSVNNLSAQAEALFAAGQFFYFRRKIDQAIEAFRQSVDLWKKSGDVEGEAAALLEFGYAYLSKSEPLEGLKKADEALSLWEKSNNIRGQALARIAVGHLNIRLNRIQAALDSYEKAEAAFPSDVDYYHKAILYNGIGTIHEDYGEVRLSLTYREKAMELLQKERHSFGQLATLASLGALNYQIGNKEKALYFLEEGRRLAKTLNDDFFAAVIFEELGNIYFQENLNDEAAEYYQNSLNLLNKISYKKETELIQDQLGVIHQRFGQNSAARRYFEDSLKTSRKIKNKFAEAKTLYSLADLDNAEARHESAMRQIENSLIITESLYNAVANSNLRKTYFSNIFDRYELYINLLMKKHRQLPDENYAVKALQAAEKSRARLTLENLSFSEADFTKDADPEIVQREKEIRSLLNAKADKLTDLLSQNAAQSETENLEKETNELEHRLEEIKATLKQNSPIYSAIKNPAPFNVAEFQRDVLDENSLLLEFSFGREESYLWLIGKTKVESYVLPAREQIESRIERLREMIASREMKPGESIEVYQGRTIEAENDYRIESKNLSAELFGQVADQIAGKRLIIVPDGKLHYFPVAALPFPNSADDAPILLTNETVYEPSAAALALLRRNGKKISGATKNLLVFSDPIFSRQDARLATTEIKNQTESETAIQRTENFRFADSLTSLARLDASEDEAEAIMEIVGDSQSTVLSGAAATRERALETSVSEYKIIHFATHGLINEARPELSGIVLSQIDEAGQPRNGVVRLRDIYAMNLSADAIVLSACGTGVGKEVRGEGLLSLNNAFLQTGAKSVVSSLWKVDDYAARELMKDFYQEMASGTATTAQALRRAQIKMRRNPQYQSPFYWAAFTVQGDFQTAPQISGDFDYRIFGLLILPLALLGIYAIAAGRIIRCRNYKSTANPAPLRPSI